MKDRKIIIAANFTAEPVGASVRGLLLQLGVEADIEFAPYNQVFQQLLDPSSVFRGNSNGINLIYLRVEDLIDSRSPGFVFGPDELAKIERAASELAAHLGNIQQFRAPTFVFVCPASEKAVADRSAALIRSIEHTFLQLTADVPNFSIFPTEHVVGRYGVGEFDNPTANVLGHVPFTDDFFDALGSETVRRIDAIWRRPHKVIVLDCDNTLWDGVVGEDGVDGIGFCEARLFLQDFVIRQSRQGMLVCLCSKNNELDVWEVFDRRPEMLLRKEHIVASRINWNPKSMNLQSLADELQLGLDSFVFVDDDSAVCSEMRANCPEVFTVELPSDLTLIPKLFEHLWIFDRNKITHEDSERTRSYQQQAERAKLQKETTNLASFLKSLEIVCDITPISHEQVPRVSQLSMRTNQFNSTTIRRSESEVRDLMDVGRSTIKTITVRDRFGEYGLVGSVFCREGETSVIVDSFMLSCRVLGRGVEHTVVRDVGSFAVRLGKEFVDIKFLATAKNAPFLNFLREVAENTGVTVDADKYRVPAAVAANISPRETSVTTTSATPEIAKSVVSNSEPAVSADVYLEIARKLAGIGGGATTGTREIERVSLASDFETASTPTERKLTDIWTSILRIENIGVLDDFFELGGDSLLAVSLFVDIEDAFGVSLPLSALISSPTIRRLSDLIDLDSGTQELKYLVPIQKGGARPPLFCMHAAGGSVLFYRDLARELGIDQPVYGLQARGVADKSETAHDRIEEMAREYLTEIRTVQPLGPYRLCGSSFGGLVAFEAAQQLSVIREKVEFLGLFDTYAQGYLESVGREQNGGRMDLLAAKLTNLLEQLREIESLGARARFFTSRLRRVKERISRKFVWKKNQFALQYGEATGKELPVDIQRNHKAIQRALQNYTAKNYDGEIILFRASNQPKASRHDPYLGWQNSVSRITVHEVKGAHGALTVHPFAADLAVALKPYLIDARPAAESAEANVAWQTA